jgi:L-threonylcarbamoyladenylate synthase
MQYFNTLVGKDIRTAKKFLDEGQVVGIPTETVYGLAGNALDENAVLKIFTAKSRPHFDPLIVHTYSPDEIAKYVIKIPAKAQTLINNFMPGPVTLLLLKKKNIPDLVTSGLDTVAIRVPDCAITLELLRSLSYPLAAPSANPFGYISPTTAQHVYDQLHGKIPYILDGGPSAIGLESTIVGFENDEPVIYRVGGLAVEEITAVIGPAKIAIVSGSNPKSPGMLESHYAPKKRTIFGEMSGPEYQNVIAEKSKKIAVIAFDNYIGGVDKSCQVLLSPSGNLPEAAKNLFGVMRQLDAGDADLIFAVQFPDIGLGRAINDRLKRASVSFNL